MERKINPESTQKYFVVLKQIYQEHINGTLNDKVLRQIIRKVSITLNIVLKTMGYVNYQNGSCKWLMGEPTMDDAHRVHVYSLDYNRLNNTKKKDCGSKPELQKNKRVDRRKQTAEIFTPPWLAQQMIDKIPIEMWKDANEPALEPSCGDGVFVELCILKKIHNIQPNENLLDRVYKSIKSVYALDIMKDNIMECRRKIFDNVIKKYLDELYENKKITGKQYNAYFIDMSAIIWHNIKTTKDTLKEDFDSWKSWDEETDEKRDEFRNVIRMEQRFRPYFKPEYI